AQSVVGGKVSRNETWRRPVQRSGKSKAGARSRRRVAAGQPRLERFEVQLCQHFFEAAGMVALAEVEIAGGVDLGEGARPPTPGLPRGSIGFRRLVVDEVGALAVVAGKPELAGAQAVPSAGDDQQPNRLDDLPQGDAETQAPLGRMGVCSQHSN